MRTLLRSVLLFLLLCLTCASAPAQVPDSGLRLALNIPAYRLEALVEGRVVLAIPVAVGTRRYPTPVGSFAVSSIVWNPWWVPPASDWAVNDTITPPCPQNPVGRVKLNFAPLYFIHGTPAEHSIGSAASHGCVRAAQQDALALAALVVRHALPDSAARAALYAAGTETRLMRLPVPVPMVVRYALAEVRGDSLWMYPDPYRRAPALAHRVRLARAALEASGPGAGVADSVLRNLAARTRLAAGAIALPPPDRCVSAAPGAASPAPPAPRKAAAPAA